MVSIHVGGIYYFSEYIYMFVGHLFSIQNIANPWSDKQTLNIITKIKTGLDVVLYIHYKVNSLFIDL